MMSLLAEPQTNSPSILQLKLKNFPNTHDQRPQVWPCSLGLFVWHSLLFHGMAPSVSTSFEHHQMSIEYSHVWHHFGLIHLSFQGNQTCCLISGVFKVFLEVSRVSTSSQKIRQRKIVHWSIQIFIWKRLHKIQMLQKYQTRQGWGWVLSEVLRPKLWRNPKWSFAMFERFCWRK